ncbi:quinone-dependent dihydroorotate dehydrogenase [Acidiferrobacter sp.]|uniref:quinone-dependent dihydroorotate dehydrogenase n=1 Tax=Acidiferrobacter sp. TaxID=1872107 RepID=UPI0026220E23|nr:quinone-dependent dihydroorotate dehydrogenase [Acidiferrobacter sp.]
MYKSLRPWLFRVPPETAHEAALLALRVFGALHRPSVAPIDGPLAVHVLGLRFANPLGLAAGFDKNGRALRGLAALGFGFLEVGTVTPRAQPGNPRPRLFRLTEQRALINRLGFNNAGMEKLAARLRAYRPAIPVGVNIGKNRDTPLHRAVDDYRLGFAALAPYADYLTVNLSSPNTPGLRALQEPDTARLLLGALREDQGAFFRQSGRHIPIAVKIAPDFAPQTLDALLAVLKEGVCDAVIATNTTIRRPTLGHVPMAGEQGGLSGVPLAALSREIISRSFKALPDIPIIGVGGINNAEEAWQHLLAGASLLQLYTGLIYEGPRLVHTILAGLADRVQAGGHDDLGNALSAARRNLSSGSRPNTVKF